MNLRLLRGLAGATSLALIATAMLSAPAMGADTRDLWIGAPDLRVDLLPEGEPDGIPDTNGSISPTPVSVPASGKGPYATMFEVDILNGGGQNLAHTILTIRADATARPGLSLFTSYDPDGGPDASPTFCTTAGDIITCDYGSLGAGQERTVAVVVNVEDSYVAMGQPTGLFTATVTTNNENGSNTQTFDASSHGFAVQPTGADSLATFVLDGVVIENDNLSTSVVAGANKLNTKVNFNAANKELVQINEGNSDTDALYECPAGLDCLADYSEVTTTSGTFANPFFTWKLTAIVPKTYSLSRGFVAHYPAGAETYDSSDTTGAYWTLLFKSKSALCGDNIAAKIASAHHCIKTLSLTKFDKTFNLLVVEVVMDAQGGMRI